MVLVAGKHGIEERPLCTFGVACIGDGNGALGVHGTSFQLVVEMERETADIVAGCSMVPLMPARMETLLCTSWRERSPIKARACGVVARGVGDGERCGSEVMQRGDVGVGCGQKSRVLAALLHEMHAGVAQVGGWSLWNRDFCDCGNVANMAPQESRRAGDSHFATHEGYRHRRRS
jgi:hypothetical protein